MKNRVWTWFKINKISFILYFDILLIEMGGKKLSAHPVCNKSDE